MSTRSLSKAERDALNIELAIQLPNIALKPIYNAIVRRMNQARRSTDLSLLIPLPITEACEAFRDAVFAGRGRFEPPCLSNEQTNAVLNEFDETIGEALIDQNLDHPWQPIETYPKSTLEQMRLWCPHTGGEFLGWHDGKRFKRVPKDFGDFDTQIYPTHWRPKAKGPV